MAGAAFPNTQTAGCAGLLGWLAVEKRRDGHATTLGAASGSIAGLVAVAAVGAYAFAVTYGIGRGIGRGIDGFMGFRASEDEERTGLDLTVHAETAYDHGVLTHGTSHGSASPHAVARPAHDRSPLG